MFEPGLYAIIDVPHPHGLSPAEVTEAVVASPGGRGASVVQLRAKAATTPERIGWLEQMAPICARAGVPLVVNDDVDAAVGAAGVAGVHLGQGDPGADDLRLLRTRVKDRSDFAIGLSTHNAGQLRDGGKQRPDYLAFGPIGPTRSKANPDPPVGFAGLADACRLAPVPIVAIGGLDRDTGARAIATGARWVAMISALVAPSASETRERAASLAEAFSEAARPLPLARVAEAIPVLPIEQLRDLAAWSDSLSVHLELGLPARFRPYVDATDTWYHPWDVMDLCLALGKEPHETWDQWRGRVDEGEISGPLVQLRVR